MIENVVLYDTIGDFPLSFDNIVSETVYPERTGESLRYFVPYEPIALQDYDPRLIDYKKVETPLSDSHPVYPIYGTWLIEHVYVKRIQEEVYTSIENARRLVNSSLIDNDLYSMGIGIALKKMNNELLTEDEDQILFEIVDIHNKIMQNYQNEKNMKAAWVNNQNINIDDGWQRS